ncbi:MAG: hypothetical protein LKJ69_01035 [Lactobacillus sp.]|jgi:hypothetical protein|nr:hypothetical protein [Lactobacillus sp.]MCI2031967.1 hypothetical protein [Lactobacillus sp.]
MNGSTAFHLKQIMSAEHLSLTQAAKQIGISPSSMRKVLKDAKMSQPLMFKINRFIDAHKAIVQTKPGELPTATAEKAATKKAPAKRPTKKADKPAAKPQAAKKTAAKKTTAKPAATTKTTQPKTAAKKPAATKASPKVTPTVTPKQPAAKKSRTQRPTKQARFTIHQSDGEPLVLESQLNDGWPNTLTKNETTPRDTPKPTRQVAKSTKATPKATSSAIKDAQQHRRRVQKRAEELSLAGVGSLEPKQPTPTKKPAATEKPEPKQTVVTPATKQPAEAEKPTPKQTVATPVAQQPATESQATTPEARQPVQTELVAPVEKSATTQTPSQATPMVATTVLAADATTAAQPAASVSTAAKTLQLFVDESFVHGNDYQRNMYIGVTVVAEDDDNALTQFADTLYPFGWQPGDEVKARGKNHDQIAAMLTQAHGPHADNFVAFSPQSDTGNFAMGFGVLYPYLATILRILSLRDNLPAKIRIVLDRRNEIQDEQLGVAARMLNSYIKAQTGQDVMFMLRTSDSKSTIGIQYSDFSAHAALTFTPEQLAACGINRLPDLGSQVGDQITLFSMIGLQKYLLDDHAAVVKPASFTNPVLVAAERLFNLSTRATTLAQVPDETLTQAKLVINQLLQISPASVNGAINKMPFQNWYDMCARASALLHYTDATLPQFEIDPDAMQIAQDALSNMYNLLAAAK